jgi:methylase of polypeptide subunit release factors
MALSKKQEEQVRKQIEGNRHTTHEVDITLTEDHKLDGFSVYEGILNPNSVAAIYLARWLFFNNGIYDGKNAIDMGCGSGIQGIVMAHYGAKKTTSSDIAADAVQNTSKNITNYSLENKVTAVQGDLFENIDDEADLIVFNHPFFAGEPYQEVPVSLAMLDDGELINRFLETARTYLVQDGRVVMPYFEMAGETNNPMTQGPKHGYQTERRFKLSAKEGLQKGDISIYELRL